LDTVRQDTELVDYDEAERLAMEHKPKLIVSGASAYSRVFRLEAVTQICDKSGALMMADIAHYAGLIAAGFILPGSLRGFRNHNHAQNPARTARRNRDVQSAICTNLDKMFSPAPKADR